MNDISHARPKGKQHAWYPKRIVSPWCILMDMVAATDKGNVQYGVVQLSLQTCKDDNPPPSKRCFTVSRPGIDARDLIGEAVADMRCTIEGMLMSV